MTREWAARLVVIYVLFVVAVVGAYEFLGSFDRAADRAADFRNQEPGRRAIAGALLLDVDPYWMTAVEAFVRPGDRYSLVTGPRVIPSTKLTFRFLPTYVRGALLPAMPAEPADAEWLLCYGCEVERFAPRFDPVWARAGYVIARRAI